MKAIGLTCGIGSMLVGARNAGFEVVGNIEWRKYYHKKAEDGKNTFRENFPGAFFVERFEHLAAEQLESVVGKIDIALGHPECGKYSQMNNNNKNFREQLSDPGDIPLFCELVSKIKPRFFVMDDLPKSLIAFDAQDYAEALPEYDLYFEWISNYHYGNVQKNRRRFFVIGALKSENFVFRSGEFAHDKTIKDMIVDLLGKECDGINAHYAHELDVASAKGQHMFVRGERATWRDVAEFVRDKKGGFVLPYVAEDGSRKTRPGSYKAHWEGHGHVLDGGSPALHPLKGVPFTIRERARIQGFPDTFQFFGIKRNEAGEWNHDKNIEIVKQTGKAMPIQFCTYVSALIMDHIKGTNSEEVVPVSTYWPLPTGWLAKNERQIQPDPYIDEAKSWFCRNVGYSDQPGACASCWLNSRCDGKGELKGYVAPERQPRQPRTITEKVAGPSERRCRNTACHHYCNDGLWRQDCEHDDYQPNLAEKCDGFQARRASSGSLGAGRTPTPRNVQAAPSTRTYSGEFGGAVSNIKPVETVLENGEHVEAPVLDGLPSKEDSSNES